MLRSTCLKMLLTAAFFIPAAMAAQPSQDEAGARTRWLEANAKPLRSVDPADEDFSDLEPLRKAIGGSRVVMLGEQSHGDGTVFLAKARLIKFLHQKMGFDVLAFESGLYDCAKAWEYLTAGEEAGKAVPRGVFGIWTGSAQVKPLIDYLGATARSSRPLELVGYDSQFTASASREFLLSDLIAFLETNGVRMVELQGWAEARPILEGVINNRYYQNKPSAEEQRVLLEVLDKLHARVKVLPAAKDARRGAAFWTQMLESMAAQSRAVFTVDMKNFTALTNNARDQQMGRNFLWLANQGYPKQKIIVWAATFHNIRHPQTIGSPEQPDLYKGLVTMGHVVWEAMGKDTYNIGFVASEGSAGAWRNPPHTLAAPPAGSLEALWAGTDQRIAFLDLKHRRTGDEWLHAPLFAGPLGYSSMRADWSQVLDAFIYTRVMDPSTPLAPLPAK